MDLKQIGDNLIAAEYRQRFYLPAGALVDSSEAAASHLICDLGPGSEIEQFAVVFLNGGNKHLRTEIMSCGTLTNAAVFPREILKMALKYHAAALILGHNHPSGNLRPSNDDILITVKIKAALATVDIALHDHIIVSILGYKSLGDEGLI